jgi:hypothetical protein
LTHLVVLVVLILILILTLILMDDLMLCGENMAPGGVQHSSALFRED